MQQVERLWIKNPLAILVEDQDARGGLVISEGKIVELVALGQEPTAYNKVYDASASVVLPGLINSHHHYYQTLTRAYPGALNQELFSWLQNLYPLWAGLEPEMLAAATKISIRRAVTLWLYFISRSSLFVSSDGMEQSIDVQVEAAKAVGIRTLFTRGSMSLGQDDGGLPPQSTVQQQEDILADSERLINKYHQRAEGAMLQIALAPCSPFSVTPEIMRESAKLAERLQVRFTYAFG